MNYSSITYPDVNNGSGCRVTLWVSGCKVHCPYCQNPQTWDFDNGTEFNDVVLEELFNLISKPYIKGLTLSGGNPLDSYDDVLRLVKKFRDKFNDEKDIWLYSGYVLDDIISMNKAEILDYIDVLVDGPYMHELKDISIPFRGSTNQRILYRNKDF
jgi:anaerobic ribonucleoside-triphosphate reductase activating protein